MEMFYWNLPIVRLNQQKLLSFALHGFSLLGVSFHLWGGFFPVLPQIKAHPSFCPQLSLASVIATLAEQNYCTKYHMANTRKSFVYKYFT